MDFDQEMKLHEDFMRLAIEQAKLVKRGLRFGAVIVKNLEVVAAAHNTVHEDYDPTGHAELLTIREAARILKTKNLRECTLYSTCEPCVMCSGAIILAGIIRVVIGFQRERALYLFDRTLYLHRTLSELSSPHPRFGFAKACYMQLITGVLAADCLAACEEDI